MGLLGSILESPAAQDALLLCTLSYLHESSVSALHCHIYFTRLAWKTLHPTPTPPLLSAALHRGCYACSENVSATRYAVFRILRPGCRAMAPLVVAPPARSSSSLPSAVTIFFHQIRGWWNEVPGVHPGYQADVIAVMHEDIDGHNVPLVLPRVQLQNLFGDNLMAI